MSVLINALLKNEFKELWDFNEEKILGLTKLGTKKEDWINDQLSDFNILNY